MGSGQWPSVRELQVLDAAMTIAEISAEHTCMGTDDYFTMRGVRASQLIAFARAFSELDAIGRYASPRPLSSTQAQGEPSITPMTPMPDTGGCMGCQCG